MRGVATSLPPLGWAIRFARISASELCTMTGQPGHLFITLSGLAVRLAFAVKQKGALRLAKSHQVEVQLDGGWVPERPQLARRPCKLAPFRAPRIPDAGYLIR